LKNIFILNPDKRDGGMFDCTIDKITGKITIKQEEVERIALK
jgi:hypothetical protein